MAVIATPQMVDPESLQQRTFWGGDLALEATQACIDDGRDMEASFILSKYLPDYNGIYTVNCQILHSETGPYYAAKGEYLPMPMLKLLVAEFEQLGYRMTD
jgi:hypothetical protein